MARQQQNRPHASQKKRKKQEKKEERKREKKAAAEAKKRAAAEVCQAIACRLGDPDLFASGGLHESVDGWQKKRKQHEAKEERKRKKQEAKEAKKKAAEEVGQWPNSRLRPLPHIGCGTPACGRRALSQF